MPSSLLTGYWPRTNQQVKRLHRHVAREKLEIGKIAQYGYENPFSKRKEKNELTREGE